MKTGKHLLNSKTPLISVIVTSYNYARFITETLNSILAQTYKNYEIIVVDDGSKDDSLEVIKQYVDKHENVFLYIHPNHENKGLSATVRLGIEKAKGEYTAFCESDDYWHPTHLEKEVELINSFDDVEIISNNVELFGDEQAVACRTEYVDTISQALSFGRNRIDLQENKYMNYIPTFSAVMIKTKIMRGLDYNSYIPAWLDFWLYRQILTTKFLFYIPEKLTYWRMHDSYNGASNAEKYAASSKGFIEASDALISDKDTKKMNDYVRVISESSLFDEAFYVKHYGCELGGFSPALHYLLIGWREGKDPSKDFITDLYLSTYPDIDAGGMNPLLHYELAGRKEGRRIASMNATSSTIISKEDVDSLLELKGKSKLILLISHELSLTGAPRALLSMALMLKDMGVKPVLLSLQDGALKKEIEDNGLKLIVDSNFRYRLKQRNNLYQQYLSLFDTVLFNTLDISDLVAYFPDSDSVKLLWLHEGLFSYELLSDRLDFKKLFGFYDHIYAVGNYSLSFAKQYTERDSDLDILLYGIPDERREHNEDKTISSKIRVLLAGAISKRKGQDLLLDAVSELDNKVRDNMEIILAGPSMDDRILDKILKCKYSCVQFAGELKHNEILKLFNEVDVVLCPSLDDPMPIVCTEAMMCGKVVIVSTATGTAGVIEDGINGFTISVGKHRELTKTLTKVSTLSFDERKKIGRNARKVYEDNFTMETFKENIHRKIVNAKKTVNSATFRLLLDSYQKETQNKYKSKSNYQLIKKHYIKSNISFTVAFNAIVNLCKEDKSFKNYRLFYKLLWYRFIKNFTTV